MKKRREDRRLIAQLDRVARELEMEAEIALLDPIASVMIDAGNEKLQMPLVQVINARLAAQGAR